MAELAFGSHLSVSQLHEFLECGEQYRQHRVLGKLPPAGLGMTGGKAFHEALAAMFEQEIKGIVMRPDPTDKSDKKAEIEVTPREVYDAIWNLNPLNSLFPKPEEGEYQKLMGEMWPLAEAAFDKYNLLDVESIELEFKVNAGKAPVVGFMDLVTKDGLIIDWKTGVKSPSEGVAEKSFQLTVYDFAYRKLYNKKPSKLGIVWATWKKGEPLFKEFWADPRGDEVMERMETRFGLLQQTLENNGPWLPAAEGHWMCSFARCPFWTGCKVRQ